MSEMENRFKADLNGWLEYSSTHSEQDRVDTESTKIRIHDNFEQTMKYYNFTERAKEALHHIIFYALTKHQDYKTDFDVPRFEETISHRDYWELIRDYDLYAYTKRELWNLDHEPAFDFLNTLYRISDGAGHVFYKTHIQIALGIDDDLGFYMVISKVLHHVKSNNPHIISLLKAAYECIENLFQIKNRQTGPDAATTQSRLKMIFDFVDCLFQLTTIREMIKQKDAVQEKQLIYSSVYSILALAEENGFTDILFFRHYLARFVRDMSKTTMILDVKISYHRFNINVVNMAHGLVDKADSRSSTLTLKEFAKTVEYQESTENEHECIFRTIVSYILLKSLPNQFDRDSVISSEEGPGFDRLGEIIAENYGGRQMLRFKLGCIQIIRKRSMFWKSILKVIIQFLDLWISDILDAKCADIFATLIARENMMPALYQHIVKHVKHYGSSNNSTSIEMIKNLSYLLEKCFDHMESNEQLFIFRDIVFNTRDLSKNVRLPNLGSTSFWNIPFEQEIIKVTNQITSSEDGVQVPEEITRKLIILSIIWPYEVLRQMLLSCAENKNQYKAIIPILYNLGNLCVLNKANRELSQHRSRQEESTLLLLVLEDAISTENSEWIENHMGNIRQFIKSCCYDKSFGPDLPLILVPNVLVDQSLAILNLKNVLDRCIIPHLKAFWHQRRSKASVVQHTILLRFAMFMLNAFCESPSANKYDLSTTTLTNANFPAILYCAPQIFIYRLTQILDARFYSTPPSLSLQDWESALQFMERFSKIVLNGLQANPTKFSDLQECFSSRTSFLNISGWQAQFSWFDIIFPAFIKSTRVPKALLEITGELNGLFTLDTKNNAISTGKMDGWYDLFTVCRLSTRLTDEIFKCSDQWMYNLILLWKHPYEHTIVEDCLYHTLYPATSLSASMEYPKLLVHFLGKLYDSFTGVLQMIRDYSGYERAEMVPFIHDLSEKGTKSYYIILYIMKLLKNSMEQKPEREDKQDTYFISSLIKVLQGLTNWANISQQGQATSYNELKLRTKAMAISDAPVCYTNSNSNDDMEQDQMLSESQSTIADGAAETKIIYYPLLNTAELISSRALSVLTVYHLCTLFHDSYARQDEAQRQATERQILQIMDGLIDMTSRQHFQRMLQQQPKSRITNWKKKESDNKFMMVMRPILTPVEKRLLEPAIVDNVPNSQQILKALDLTSMEEERVDKKMSRKEHLYFS